MTGWMSQRREDGPEENKKKQKIDGHGQERWHEDIKLKVGKGS